MDLLWDTARVNSFEQAASYADRIEQELRGLGWWQSEPPPPSAFESRRAFYGDTMAFSQWLQFVLLARIRSIVAESGAFPADSSVGSYAVRELDGQDEAHALIQVLIEFDQFIKKLG